MLKQLQLRITESARRRIGQFLQESGMADPIPGLLLRMKTDEREEAWTIGAYGQEQVRELEETYALNGLVLMYEADGIELCVPQTHLVTELNGKTLDYQEGHYVVIGPFV